ncbi:MAG: tetratricopeptide repeat protein [Balneola sp.]
MKLLATILGILFVGTSFAYAQDDCNPNPPEGYTEIAAFSIFQGNYRNEDFPLALKFGRWMLCKNPTEIEGIPTGRFKLSLQYPKFIDMYTKLGLAKEDPSERETYIDSALALYEKSFELFAETPEEEYELYQRRGRYFLENYNAIDDGLQKAYQDFEAMFKLDAEQTTTTANGYYIRVTVDNMVRQDRKDEVVAMIEIATSYADADIQSFFDETLGKLFKAPEERLEFFCGKLEENPDDLEALKACADAQEDLDMQTELIVTLKKIHELEPSFASALALADIEKGNAKYSEAAALYKEALLEAPDNQSKKEINIDLSDVYASMGQLQTSKQYINAALKIDPNYGIAYIKMASIYGQAVSSCSDGRKLEAKDKVVYWVVVDYLNKAKSVDPSVTNTVNSQLATYEAVTPSTEDKFFTLSYEDGQSVKVDGSLMSCYSWINETTTVR